MEVTGVQSGGARSLAAVSVTVTDSTQSATRVGAAVPDREITTSAPHDLGPEAVVFPRDGKPLDQRPVQLRRQRAHARYRADGGGSAPGGDAA